MGLFNCSLQSLECYYVLGIRLGIMKNQKNCRIVFVVDDRVVKDFRFVGIYWGWPYHSLLSSGVLPNKYFCQVHAAFTARARL